MMQKRTTVTAPADALATLEADARRRGLSLTAVLAEAVNEKAASIRNGRRPRVGIARSTDGRSAREVTSEPIAESPK
ncbi:MAG TPA: ribbon-helix-helix protein, CopG family [Solirubrobacterales bacterium]|jgi:hypothetical protein